MEHFKLKKASDFCCGFSSPAGTLRTSLRLEMKGKNIRHHIPRYLRDGDLTLCAGFPRVVEMYRKQNKGCPEEGGSPACRCHEIRAG